MARFEVVERCVTYYKTTVEAESYNAVDDMLDRGEIYLRQDTEDCDIDVTEVRTDPSGAGGG